MVSSLPSLPDDKGSVVITHSQGNIVDEVAIRKNGILPRWVKLTNTVNGAIDVTPKAFFPDNDCLYSLFP